MNAYFEQLLSLGKTKVIFVYTLANDPRALKDVASMEAACKAFGFDFECVTTFSNADLQNLSQRLADDNYTKFSKIVVMILGHGNQKDKIVSHNGNFFS
jgi:hypothetical protein